jgi:hypothetical protein
MNPVHRLSTVLSFFLLLLAGSRGVGAQPAKTQITVAGSPSLVVSTIVAGSSLASVSSTGLTYFVKALHPSGAQKVMVQLSATMPAGTTLTLAMVTPPSAVNMGPVILDTTTRDILLSVDKEGGSTYGLTYTLSATLAAGIIASQSRVVTFTMVTSP